MSDYRTERDSMGELQVPVDALYGAQTQRAFENFPISGLTMPRQFIRALGLIKATAAEVNRDLGLLEAGPAGAIARAAEQVAAGEHDAHFPVDVFQTGSGTSSNMNANEVIAQLASREAGAGRIHPNDHVNMGQSSNDVIPTAIHVAAALAVQEHLLPALDHLQSVIDRRAAELDAVVKTGRTHLMDAMPVTLGQELGGWSSQISAGSERLRDSLQRVLELAQGGTAVGTGINAHPEFGSRFAARLGERCGLHFRPGRNYFQGLSSQDAAVELSGQLRTLAVSLMKIANDLRWMNSGPLAGLGEIVLPALQPGSSIMPGKVNPVVPEAVTMVCAQVMGNDATVAIAGQSGNFQLNVMLPVIGYNLLQSVELLGNGSRILADRAIAGFTVNTQRLERDLGRNPILVTALNRTVGYEKGAAIAKQAYQEGRPVIDVAAEISGLDRETLERLLDPRALTRGGIPE
ncbi:MAG: class II fumarate hydratase [Ectothiorhodospiraceae bacterium]|nr:class II fumarate hydratase [Ectothiorhodospiraceae bacterium]